MAFDVEVNDGTAATYGEKRSRRCGTNAGERLGAFDQTIEKFIALFRLGISRLRKRQIGDEKMIGLEARRNFLQTGKTAKQQSRTDEQQHCQGNFHGHKSATKTVLAGPGGRPARAFVESLAQIQPRRAQRRDDSKDKSREQRDTSRKSKNPAIQSDGRGWRHTAGGNS